MKKILALLICLSMLFGLNIGVFAADDSSVIPTIIILDKKIDTKELATVENGKVLLPLRQISELLDFNVTWDNENRAVKLTKNDKVILLRIGEKEIKVNSKIVVLDKKPMIKDGRTLVSLGFLTAGLGIDVDYDIANKIVSIKEKVFNEKVEIEYSSGFTIDNLGDNIKLITDGEGRKSLLVPRTSEIPEGYENVQIVRTPIKNVILSSTTQACAFNVLNELDAIGGVTSDAKTWHIPEIKSGIENGTIKFIGRAKTPDFELIQEMKPELVFVYTGSYPQTLLIDKLIELEIPYVVNNEYMEASALGRLEWLKFEAAFFNKDLEAKKYFDDSVKQIEDVKKAVKGLDSPKVAWAMVSRGTVYCPNAGSYVGEMIAAAGGDYIFKNQGIDKVGSTKLTLEEFYAVALDADIIIYSSNRVYSIADVIDKSPILEDLKAIKSGNIWAFHPSWWQTIDKTGDKYVDLANIFFPEDIKAASDSMNFVKLK